MGCCTADQLPGPSAGPAATITEQELKQAYCSSVQALKDYLLVSQLTSYDITGRSLRRSAACRAQCNMLADWEAVMLLTWQ